MKSPKWRSDGSPLHCSRSRTVQPQLPGSCRRLLEHISLCVKTRTKSGSRREDTSLILYFLFFLFFICTKLLFVPVLFFFFFFKWKGALVLITWLQFTWDLQKKEREKKNRGERRNERVRESDREMHSWLGFPYRSQHSKLMKKVVIFGLEASVSHGGDTRGHCCEEQRVGLYPCGPECPFSCLFSANQHCLILSARSCYPRGVDAIITITRGHKETRCARLHKLRNRSQTTPAEWVD